MEGRAYSTLVNSRSEPEIPPAGAPETVAARIRRALPHVRAEQIVVAPDCGLKYLPRDVAFGKIYAMFQGAKIVRRELTGHNET